MARRGFPIRRVLLAALLLAVLGACSQVTPGDVTLTVTVAGSGTGTVTSVPAGIDVTSGDEPDILEVTTGEAVTLTATAVAGSTFDGWTGGCSGTDPCVLAMNTDTEVTATFTLDAAPTRTLTVTVAGSGTGTVTSVPAGIDVTSGDDPDTLEVTFGEVVTLTATAGAGSTFDGWTGACSGTDPCVLDMDADFGVTATFTLAVDPDRTLTVGVVAAGTADGSVTSDPAGIDTGTGADVADFDVNEVVTLTATATVGAFAGWVGGGCDDVDAPVCAVTMNTDTTVTATFNDIQTLTVRTGANTDDGVEFLGDSVAGQGFTPAQWLEGWVWTNRTYLDLGWAPFHNLTEAGFRFPAVDVPAGARVVSAILQVTAAPAEADGGGFPTTGAMTLTIEGEASLEPAALVQPVLTAVNFDVTTRARTDESVTWNITENWASGDVHQAPDAAAILQEIVNQAGWLSGNPVMLMLKGGAENLYRRVHTFDSGSPDTRHPTLLIEYVVMPALP